MIYRGRLKAQLSRLAKNNTRRAAHTQLATDRETYPQPNLARAFSFKGTGKGSLQDADTAQEGPANLFGRKRHSPSPQGARGAHKPTPEETTPRERSADTPPEENASPEGGAAGPSPPETTPPPKCC